MNNEKINSKIKLIFRYFNIRNFEISKYWSFQVLTPTPNNIRLKLINFKDLFVFECATED